MPADYTVTTTITSRFSDHKAVIPAGYRWTGEVRRVRLGELFIFWDADEVSTWLPRSPSKDIYPIVKQNRP
jgi:hypothetical protein